MIRRLPRLDAQHHRFLQNVVFLVTPALVKWLGDNGQFLEAAMQHIYRNFTYVEGMHAIQSSVAVVDRLPSPVRVRDPAKVDSSNRKAETIHGYEGIALWIDSMRANPDILGDSTNEDPNERLVRMTFVRPKHSWDSITAIELRPANTLFV